MLRIPSEVPSQALATFAMVSIRAHWPDCVAIDGMSPTSEHATHLPVTFKVYKTSQEYTAARLLSCDAETIAVDTSNGLAMKSDGPATAAIVAAIRTMPVLRR